MSLWKRGAVWWAYFYIDGVRYQQSTGTSNRRIAEQVLQQLKDDVVMRKHQLPLLDPAMTFGALAARFIANADPHIHHFDRLKVLLPYFADMPLRLITKPVVREYRQWRHQHQRLKDATINRDVSVLRHLLYWAVDEGLLEANPIARIKLMPERRSPKPVLTVEEERKLLSVVPEHLHDLIVMALETGMRRGELLNQRWPHVDFNRSVLMVTRSKTIEGEGREIPLSTRARAILDARRQDEGLVFQYRDNRVNSVKTSWRTALKRAGIRHVRFHDLRHTFNTRLLEAGVLQEVRKELMGHTSGAGVHSVYTHIELPLKRKAIAALEQWWREQSLALDQANHKEEHHEPAAQDAREVHTEDLEEENPR
ncbi:MAG: tyrosine-type recombinase/integrase [Bryobacteraceae bacterium]